MCVRVRMHVCVYAYVCVYESCQIKFYLSHTLNTTGVDFSVSYLLRYKVFEVELYMKAG